jgi:copper transport protein
VPRSPATSRRGVGWALVTALVGLVLALAWGASPAAAHATLQSTDPAADALVDAVPEAVALTFDEPVAAPTGAVQVVSPTGDRVDGAVTLSDGDLVVRTEVDGEAKGTYTVVYRVVSDDGHTIAGSFVFHVETRTGAASIDQAVPTTTAVAGAVGRWLGYAGAVTVVGSALLLLLARRSGGIGRALRPLSSLIAAAAVAATLGGLLAVTAQVASTTGRSLTSAVSLVGEVAGDSRPVAVSLARTGMVAIGAVIALVGAARRSADLLLVAGVAVALGGLLAPAAGHPWTSETPGLAVTADALHLLAAACWLGMLVGLIVATPRLPDPPSVAVAVSRSALVAAVVVGLTGAVSTWSLIGSVDALFDTSSGQLVLLKIIGYGTLLVLGWINRSRLVPLLGRAAGADEHPADADGVAEPPLRRPLLARRQFLQVVGLEVVVGALVLAATAGLVNQPPGRDQLERPFSGTERIEDTLLRLEVTPARVGENEAHVYATNPDGTPAAIDAIEVRVGRTGVPERRVDTEQISPDHAVMPAVSLPSPGPWTFRVTIVQAGSPLQLSFEVPVR